jgi:hypothetical protein
MLVAEKFIRSLVVKYGNHLVYNSQRDGKSRTSLDLISIVIVTILTSILVPLVFGIG